MCGDVGFGKTEVAIRAMFKAVMDGKQVAYLVPTTVLAQQHYNNFKERMKDFPVTVEMISRFRKKAEQKKILKDVKAGVVDIIVGTHRLLQKDVVFKDLGLLVIDEEQRFGVKHKEESRKSSQMWMFLPRHRFQGHFHVSHRNQGYKHIEISGGRYPVQTYVMSTPEFKRCNKQGNKQRGQVSIFGIP